MNDAATQKCWFVTGASRGFGRHWVEAALARGDRVAATARDVDDLSDLAARYRDKLLPLALDVTDRGAVFATVAEAHARLGRLDVVVSNAGYGLFGAVEEIDEAEARRQMEVNFFGGLSVIQAALPILREQNAGQVLITSSFGGLVNFATAGLYGASKFALEALGEALSQEVRDFGIRVTLIEPAAYSTDFSGSSAAQAGPIAAYDAARNRTGAAFEAMPPGDPAHTSPAILALVDASDPPLRLMLGKHALPYVRARYQERLDEWGSWSEVANSAQ